MKTETDQALMCASSRQSILRNNKFAAIARCHDRAALIFIPLSTPVCRISPVVAPNPIKKWPDAGRKTTHTKIQKITKRTHFKFCPPTGHQPLAPISSQTSSKNEPIFTNCRLLRAPIHSATVCR
jgi:hypothetical protein